MAMGSNAVIPELRKAYQALYAGNYERGFQMLEHRIPNKYPIGNGDRNSYTRSMIWHPGVPVKGRHIVVDHEGGRGDIIQFSRFIPLLENLGVASITILCLRELVSLVRRLGYKTLQRPDDSIERGSIRIKMMSLPALLLEHGLFPKTWTDKHYKSEGYFANPSITEKNDKIGIQWYTTNNSWNHKYRKIPHELVEKVVNKFPTADIVSLQMENTFLTKHLNCDSMAGSADAIQQLKAVIAIDSAVLHLAGSVGTKTYGLVGNGDNLCWRWFPKQPKTSWYDSVTCIYNEPYDNWETSMTLALEELCH
jgi:hypothetical protein